MPLFACPHCDAVVEFLAGDVSEPQCDCGAILEPSELEASTEPLSEAA